MANNIALAKTFVPILDEIYKLASLTSKLDGAAELARQGANSDADVAVCAGNDVRHCVVGAGVYASHGYERDHQRAFNKRSGAGIRFCCHREKPLFYVVT